MGIYTIENGYEKRTTRRLWVVILLVIAGCVLSGYNVYKPKAATPAANNTKPATEEIVKQPKKITAPLPWPTYGQAAYGVLDEGVLATSNDNATPVPVASLAKVITALAILNKKPLNAGEQGPMITLDEHDVALFGDYIRKDGAVVFVEAGEQISQYQAMQAMLMSSANNMSDSLTRWAFGSVENYTVYANAMVKDLGLSNTTVADASGFSPGTVSTAHDMVQLGTLYMKHPVLLDIATQPEATIPVAGVIRNYNSVSNKDGIMGIKVGNTDEAGRCFLAADIRESNGSKRVVSVVAVVGAEHLATAMNDAQSIISAGNTGYDQITRN